MLPVNKKERNQYQAEQFQTFQHGLNTSVPATQIKKTELAACINWKITDSGGQYETREGIDQYTTLSTTSNAAVKALAYADIGGTDYELIVDDNNILYYLDSGEPTTIGTLAGDNVHIFPFNGVALICDGSYLKYCDSVSTVKLAYDDGSGADGYFVYGVARTADASYSLSSVNPTRAGIKFTVAADAWDTGYTLPLTQVDVYLEKTGSPTGNITCVVYTAAGATVATASETVSAASLDGTSTLYEFTFATGALSLNTVYYACILFSGGDGSNTVNIAVNNIGSGGDGVTYSGSFSADVTKAPKMGVKPGLPPKAYFGCVHLGKPWIVDPDEEGLAKFGNGHLDWSTSSYAGYIGSIDDNANNYAIGALISQYEELLIIGQENSPYLAKLTGTDSDTSTWSIKRLFGRSWTTHKTLIDTGNDALAASKLGVGLLTGVQEYGDWRRHLISKSIQNKITQYWDSDTAIGGFNPANNQNWLCMPSYHRVLVCHLEAFSPDPTGVGVRYPWAEYEFFLRELTDTDTYKWTESAEAGVYYVELKAGGDPSFDAQPDAITMDGQRISNQETFANIEDHEWYYGDEDTLGYNTVYFKDATGDPDSSGIVLKTILIPTALGTWNSKIYIGASDGYVYHLDPDSVKDLSSIHINPVLATANIRPPFRKINITRIQIDASSKGGAQGDVYAYRDGAISTALTTYNLPIHDGLTVDEAVMDVDDALFSIDAEASPTWKNTNFDCWSVQFALMNVTLSGYPLYFNSFMFLYRILED